MAENNTYIGIKADTTFPIQVSGKMLTHLQKLLLYLLVDKSQEEIEKAHKMILENKFEEEWYEHFAFLSYLITHIEQTAHTNGHTVVESLNPPEN